MSSSSSSSSYGKEWFDVLDMTPFHHWRPDKASVIKHLQEEAVEYVEKHWFVGEGRG